MKSSSCGQLLIGWMMHIRESCVILTILKSVTLMQNHQLSRPNTNKHFPLQHPVLKTQKQVFNADKRQSRCIIKCTDLFFKYFEVNVTERHIGHCMLSRCNGLRNALNPRFIGYRVCTVYFLIQVLAVHSIKSTNIFQQALQKNKTFIFASAV